MIWKLINGWPYEVSDTGLVRNSRTGHILTPMRCGRKRKQYSTVRLCVGGAYKDVKVAHLVLEAFKAPRPAGMIGRHLDDNDHNNDISNLEWGTHKENACDRRKNKPVKLTIEQAEEIRLRRGHERGADLAREFGVSQQTICDIHKDRIHTGEAK